MDFTFYNMVPKIAWFIMPTTNFEAWFHGISRVVKGTTVDGNFYSIQASLKRLLRILSSPWASSSSDLC